MVIDILDLVKLSPPPGVGLAAKPGSKTPLLPCLLLALILVGSGCGASIMDRLSQANISAVAARKSMTAYMDPRCSAIEKTCPKESATSKLLDCKAYAACDAQRHTGYQIAASVETGLHATAALAQLDEKGAENLLPALLSEVTRLITFARSLVGGL